MQPAIFSAEIEQGVAVRFELCADDAADEDEMVARLVKRFALAFERHERAAEEWHTGLPRRPRLVGEPVLALGGEPVRCRLLADLQDIDPEMRRVAQYRRGARLVGDAHRSEEHTSELQSLMRISSAVF